MPRVLHPRADIPRIPWPAPPLPQSRPQGTLARARGRRPGLPFPDPISLVSTANRTPGGQDHEKPVVRLEGAPGPHPPDPGAAAGGGGWGVGGAAPPGGGARARAGRDSLAARGGRSGGGGGGTAISSSSF